MMMMIQVGTDFEGSMPGLMTWNLHRLSGTITEILSGEG